MPVGWYGLICSICFRPLTPEECAVDGDGAAWDVCRGLCAQQSGLQEGSDAVWERCTGPCGREYRFPHLCREHLLCGLCHPSVTGA